MLTTKVMWKMKKNNTHLVAIQLSFTHQKKAQLVIMHKIQQVLHHDCYTALILETPSVKMSCHAFYTPSVKDLIRLTLCVKILSSRLLLNYLRSFLKNHLCSSAYVEKYLLEKSRLVYQEHNER